MKKNSTFLNRTFAFLLCALFSTQSFAAIISYDFEFQLNNATYLTGNFVAEDTNLDSFIRDAELISISFANDTYSISDYVFSAATSNNFNFDLNSELFLIGGLSSGDSGQKWNTSGGTGFGFITGSACAGFYIDGSFQGCDATPATLLVQLISAASVAEVPAPSTVLLFGLGLLGLSVRAKRAA